MLEMSTRNRGSHAVSAALACGYRHIDTAAAWAPGHALGPSEIVSPVFEL